MMPFFGVNQSHRRDLGDHSLTFNSHHAGHGQHRVEPAKIVDRGTQRRIGGAVGHNNQLRVGPVPVLPYGLMETSCRA